MSRAIPAILAVLMLLLPASAGANVQPPEPEASALDGAPHATDRVVVRWREYASAPAQEQARGLRRLEPLGERGTSLLSTEGQSVDAVLADLRADPAVEWAEPDYQVRLMVDEPAVGETAAVVTDDPRLGEQYSLNRMRVRDAWSLTHGGSHVVAVLDTGIQWVHPELSGRVAQNAGETGSGRETNGVDDDHNGFVDDYHGWDFVNDDRDARDDNDHGTWVSGIISAVPDNGIGIAGISWSNRILPVKVMNADGLGWTSDLALGIDYATNRGARIINMSVGGFPGSQAVADAVNRAWSRGVVLVAAAGNARSSVPSYPAAFPNVVSVSATQADDELTYWTNYGTSIDLSAPGASVTTTDCGGCSPSEIGTPNYTVISGTSFAAPNVAGVVALIRARYPTYTNAQVVSRLLSTVDDLGFNGTDNRYGRGRVNAFRAVGGVASQPADALRDGLEPNDTLSSARPISLNRDYAPTIRPAGEIDVVRVDVPRAGAVTIRVDAVVDTTRLPKSSLPVDPVVELYDVDGTRILRRQSSNPAADEVISLRTTGPTRYFIRTWNGYPNGSDLPYITNIGFVDDVSPRPLNVRPQPGSSMLPASSRVTMAFTEPVRNVSAGTFRLRLPNGSLLPASVTYDDASHTAALRPTTPLPTGVLVKIELDAAIVDLAGRTIGPQGWTFRTAPGAAYAPWRPVTLAAGAHTGYRMDAAGTLLELRPNAISHASSAHVSQRATLPNLPGDWLYVEDGIWGGTWIPESARAKLAGTTELANLAPTIRLALNAGTHTGYRFTAAGGILEQRTRTLSTASGANVDARAVINGRVHHRVTNGIWAGTWIPESAVARQAGVVGVMAFTPDRHVLLAAGPHTGVILGASHDVIGTRSATLSRASGATAIAWAVVHGRPSYRIANGIWAGSWVPADGVIRLDR